MKRFEYKWVHCNKAGCVIEMNKYGKEGWEVFSINETPKTCEMDIIFKREINEETVPLNV